MGQYIEDIGGLTQVKLSRKLMTGLAVDFSNAPSVALPGSTTIAGTGKITSTSATAFTVASTGTNYGLQVDESVSSAVTGLKIQPQASGNGVKLSTISSALNDSLYIDCKGTGNIVIGGLTAASVIALDAPTTVNIASATALIVGPNGGTNPTLLVVTNTASAATGVSITSAAAAAGVAIATISSGTDENLTIAAKGAGSITFNPAVVAAAGGKASSGLMFGSLGVGLFTGTGAPSFSAMNGSIYVDSEATSTTTRIYVNKSGAHTAGTTWTNLTTAA